MKKKTEAFLLPTVKGNIITNQQYIRILDKKPVRKLASARTRIQVKAPKRVTEHCSLLEVVKTLIPEVKIKTK